MIAALTQQIVSINVDVHADSPVDSYPKGSLVCTQAADLWKTHLLSSEVRHADQQCLLNCLLAEKTLN